MKKITILLLSASILSTFVTSALAAEFSQGNILNSFDTLQGFVNQTNTITDSTLPAGWKAFGDLKWRATPIESSFMSNTNVMKIGNPGFIIHPFDETIRKGKVHVSFDMKFDNPEKANFVFYGHTGLINNNPNDYYSSNVSDYSYAKFLTCRDGKYILYSPGMSWDIAPMNVIINKDWHKYDYYFDMNSKNYSIYIDGLQLYQSIPMGTDSLKSFYFFCSQDYCYMDNLYMKHYQTQDAMNDVEIAADYNNGGVALSNGIVNVAFSEAIDNSLVLFPTDFTVKNTITKQVVNVEDVQHSPISGINLTLPAITAGEYEVTCNLNELVGAVSGKKIINKASFITATCSAGQTPYYYLKDTFDNYKGGMPAGWKKAAENNYNDSEMAAYVAGTGPENTTDINIVGNGEKTIMYQFNQNIYSGKFTVEMDIKHTNGNWALGLVGASEFMPYDYVSEDVVTSKKTSIQAEKLAAAKAAAATAGETFVEADWIKNIWPNVWTQYFASAESLPWRHQNYIDRAYNNILMGSFLKNNPEKLQYVKTKSNLPEDTWVAEGITIPANKWTHIKAVVDMDAGTYTFSADNGVPTTVEFDNQLFKREVLINKDTGYKSFVNGIAGIRIQKNGEGTGVEYDNLKVYTDTSYNDYQTFDNFATTAKWQSGWYYPNIPYKETHKDMLGVVGKDKNGVKFSHTAGETHFTHPFAVPIKAGASFDMEFDIKSEDVNKNVWALSIVDKEDMYCTGKNTYVGRPGVDAAPNGEIVEENKGVYFNQNVVLTNRKVAGAEKQTFKFGNGSTNWDFKDASTTTGTALEWKNNEWHHVKLSVNNKGTATTFKLFVTYADGTTVESAEYNANSKYNRIDMYGISLWNIQGNAEYIIDNLKVFEKTAVHEPVVASIKTVETNGAKSIVNDNVNSTVLELEANLTSALTSADAIRIFYPLSGTENGANENILYNATISEDGKKVYIAFSEMPKLNEYITIEIGNKSVFGMSYLANFNTDSITFKFVPQKGELTVTDFRVYEWIEGRTKTDKSSSCIGAWAPVTAKNLKNYKADSKLKIVVKGYNTGDIQKLFINGADYSTDAEGKHSMIGINSIVKDAPKGKFDIELSNVSILNNSTVFKGFLWNNSNLTPFKSIIEYSK